MNNIETLLQAAEYLERKDREAEHGYASSLPMPVRNISRRKQLSKQRKSQGSRSSHNELEKNRRAHLKYCLEQLKNMVPLGPESSRHTTLRLLTDAKTLIKSLQENGKHQKQQRDRLLEEQKTLRWHLARETVGIYRSRPEHTLSECSSTSTNSSSSSNDEVDVTSCSSNELSDSEDQMSVHSDHLHKMIL